MKRIKDVTGEGFNWKGIKDEGWTVEKAPKGHFAFYIIFENESAEVMFYLKYGIQKWM